MKKCKSWKTQKKKKKRTLFSWAVNVVFLYSQSEKPCSLLSFWADGVSTTFQNTSARGEKKKVILHKIILLSRG